MTPEAKNKLPLDKKIYSSYISINTKNTMISKASHIHRHKCKFSNSFHCAYIVLPNSTSFIKPDQRTVKGAFKNGPTFVSAEQMVKDLISKELLT